MSYFFAILFSFLCGSLPFSVWLGKLFLKRDVRLYGDGNPGATNVFRAGNNYIGLLALLLDISKAAAPVGWFYHDWGFRGTPMFLIAMAPILGHAFSPFLKFRGGKAISTALGTWIGLTIWKASLPGVLAAFVGVFILTPPGWSVMIALGAILITLLAWYPDSLLISVWVAQVVILGWKHRDDLCQAPKIRPWFQQMFRRETNDD
jgi:glycerol-3-phosphate acyltransferase PlsY